MTDRMPNHGGVVRTGRSPGPGPAHWFTGLLIIGSAVITDLAVPEVAQFWRDHAMVASICSTALVLLISGLVLDRIVESRQQKRREVIVANIALSLRQEIALTLESIRTRLGEEIPRVKDSDQHDGAEQMRPRRTQFGPGESLLFDRVIRWRKKPRKSSGSAPRNARGSSSAENLLAKSSLDPRLAPVASAGLKVVSALHRIDENLKLSASVSKQLLQIVDVETRTLRTGLSSAAPFLAETEAGQRLLRSGFDIVSRLRTVARSGSAESAISELESKSTGLMLSAFDDLVASITHGILLPEPVDPGNLRDAFSSAWSETLRSVFAAAAQR